jgi:protein-S-isoprenylcysteine O-methyltransferase Ste14
VAKREDGVALAPDFELGLWNAWIIMAAFSAASFLVFMVNGSSAEARMEDEPSFGEAGAAYRVAIIVSHPVLMPLTMLYGVFVPLERGNWWLFSGLAVSVAAIAMALAAAVSFVTAPLDEPMTRGVYAISRHPMYTAAFLAYVGVGLAGASWVFLVFAVVRIVAWRFGVPEEEANMTGKYGASYEEHLRRTPRWLGLPRARRCLGWPRISIHAAQRELLIEPFVRPSRSRRPGPRPARRCAGGSRSRRWRPPPRHTRAR